MEQAASDQSFLKKKPSDTELDKSIMFFKKDFKYNVKWELRRREYFRPPRPKKKRTNPVPFLPQDLVAYSLLRRARLVQDAEVYVKGAENMPTGENISGSVAVIQIIGGEEERYIMTLDRRKQKYDEDGQIKNPLRWSFPGGRREEREPPVVTLLRELKEEINIFMRRFTFTFIDTVPLVHAPDLLQTVFFTKIPEKVAEYIRPGKEQLKVEIFTRAQMESMAAQDLETVLELGVLLDNHGNYLAAFRKWELMEKITRIMTSD